MQKEKSKLPINSQNFEKKISSIISKKEIKKASSLLEEYIDSGNIIQNKNLLKFILEPSGMTVAHLLAHNSVNFSDPEILKLKGIDRSQENAIFGHNGVSVAFILAKKGFFFEDREIQLLGSEENRATVAHAMANNGYIFKNPDILRLRDSKGNTVAHVMANNGHNFESPEILNLENNFGFTVKDFQD